MEAEYKVLSILNLPLTGVRKQPGDTVTSQELEENEQTDEDVELLIGGGALSDDMDAELHPDHRPISIAQPSIEQMVNAAKATVERMGDDAPDEVKELAKMELNHAASSDDGKGGEANA